MAMRVWWRQPLEALSDSEWEALCDGCGLCCLHKLEDDDTGDVHYTALSCEQLDIDSCRCRDYTHRETLVPGCLKLTPQNYPQMLPWLPSSCAYRRVAFGLDLPDWHPLRAGDTDALHAGGHSVRGRVQSAAGIDPDDYVNHLLVDQPLRWV